MANKKTPDASHTNRERRHAVRRRSEEEKVAARERARERYAPQISDQELRQRLEARFPYTFGKSIGDFSISDIDAERERGAKPWNIDLFLRIDAIREKDCVTEEEAFRRLDVPPSCDIKNIGRMYRRWKKKYGSNPFALALIRGDIDRAVIEWWRLSKANRTELDVNW
jgi:hypothetical protein